MELAGGMARPAHAQFSGNVSLATNEVFRGETISSNDPALSLALGFDGPAGIFAGASASVAAGGDAPRINSSVQYLGYAIRKGEVSLEAGVIHRNYRRVVDGAYRKQFFEGYVGIARRALKARLHVSPDYLRDGRTTYYGEVNARLLALGKWGVDGHAGLSLIPHDIGSGRKGLRHYRDWRVQVSRPVGRAFVSAGAAGTNYPVYSTSGKARAFASLSYAF